MTQTRRTVIATLAACALLPGRAQAAVPIGAATGVAGPATLRHAGGEGALAVGNPLHEGDAVRTGDGGQADLLLNTATRLTLGPGAEVMLDRWLAEVGGEIRLGGPMVFDRPDDPGKIDLTVQTAFGSIGVRGTRFFAGPSNGVFAVFVSRGAVAVSAGGVSRALGPGDGVNLPGGGAPPTEVARWGAARIAAAFAQVGLVP
jgi:hypothetical protein